MTNKLEISELSSIRREPLINAARGILPVATSWGTPPSNLNLITDGDPFTATGFGTTVLGGSGNVGFIAITVPTYGIYLCSAILGLYTSAGTINLFWQSNPDGVNVQSGGASLISSGNTTEIITNSGSRILAGTTFSMQIRLTAAGTCNVRIFELYAYKIG